LWRKRQFERVLKIVAELLPAHSLSPWLWITKADAILLSETSLKNPLEVAEQCYLKALSINPKDLDALESLAHFYDAIVVKPRLARKYARQFLMLVSDKIEKMRSIAGEE
jgi:hypothetical protein